MRKLIAIALLLVASPALAAAGDRPKVPSVETAITVGECSHYGVWWATQRMPVYKEERNTDRVLFYLEPHERLKALTGNVHVLEAGWFVVPKKGTFEGIVDQTGVRFKPGETVYVLYPESEGFWRVWYKGRQLSADLTQLTTFKKPRWEWWAKIHNRFGRFGWIRVDNAPPIEGVDSCGMLAGWAEKDRRSIPPDDYWYRDAQPK